MNSELQVTSALLESWPALTPEERLEAFERIPRAELDDFFLELPPRDQAALILALPVGAHEGLFTPLLERAGF